MKHIYALNLTIKQFYFNVNGIQLYIISPIVPTSGGELLVGEPSSDIEDSRFSFLLAASLRACSNKSLARSFNSSCLERGL